VAIDGKNRKFMQVFKEDVYGELAMIAKQKDVSIQELLRAVVIPEWLVNYRNHQGPIFGHRKEQAVRQEQKKDSWPYVASMPRAR
jgi:hypothetical protein